MFRVVKLGGHKVRKPRDNAADAYDAADVFLYCDSSIAPLLDMRRRFKAVIGVLYAMIRHGVSLSRSVQLTFQWDRILAVGPWYPVSIDDLSAVRGLGIGDFYRVVSGVHHRLGDFIHAVVVHRRDEAIREWRNWIREDPMVHPYERLRPDLVLPAPFLQCKPHLTPGESRVDLPWCRYLAAHEGVQPQLYADNLKCVSGDPVLLFSAARFTTRYVRLVDQEPAPSKCVLLITSRVARKDMKDWVLSQEGLCIHRLLCMG